MRGFSSGLKPKQCRELILKDKKMNFKLAFITLVAGSGAGWVYMENTNAESTLQNARMAQTTEQEKLNDLENEIQTLKESRAQEKKRIEQESTQATDVKRKELGDAVEALRTEINGLKQKLESSINEAEIISRSGEDLYK